MATTSLQIKNVYNGGKTYLFEEISVNTTIKQLKELVHHRLEEHPSHGQQRLIYCGKICDDDSTLSNVLQRIESTPLPHILHLVLSSRGALARTSSEGSNSSELAESAPSSPQLFRAQSNPIASMSAPEAPATTSSPLTRAEVRAAAAAAAEARLSSKSDASPVSRPVATLQTSLAYDSPPPPATQSIREQPSPQNSSFDGTRAGSQHVHDAYLEAHAAALLTSPTLLRESAAAYQAQGFANSPAAAAAAAAVFAWTRPQPPPWPTPHHNWQAWPHLEWPHRAWANHASPSQMWPNQTWQNHALPSQALNFDVAHRTPLSHKVSADRSSQRSADNSAESDEEEKTDGDGGGGDDDDGAPRVAEQAGPDAPAAGPAPAGPAGPERRRVIFFVVDMNDVKFALKLAVGVLLLSQNGDAAQMWMLAGCAAVGFLAHLAMAHRQRAHQRALAAAPALPAPTDDVQALPPLRMRGILEGGIAPGGGLGMDLSYLVVSFVASLLPTWQPQPAFDPALVALRRRFEQRLHERAAAAAAAESLGNEVAERHQQPAVAVADEPGHMHRD